MKSSYFSAIDFSNSGGDRSCTTIIIEDSLDIKPEDTIAVYNPKIDLLISRLLFMIYGVAMFVVGALCGVILYLYLVK